MIIQKINEFNGKRKLTTTVYTVIVFDNGGFINTEQTFTFYDAMMAMDYFTKWINLNANENFEPFYEGDTRLFSKAEDNDDWHECLSYAEENELNIEFIVNLVQTNPVTDIQFG